MMSHPRVVRQECNFYAYVASTEILLIQAVLISPVDLSFAMALTYLNELKFVDCGLQNVDICTFSAVFRHELRSKPHLSPKSQ